MKHLASILICSKSPSDSIADAKYRNEVQESIKSHYCIAQEEKDKREKGERKNTSNNYTESGCERVQVSKRSLAALASFSSPSTSSESSETCSTTGKTTSLTRAKAGNECRWSWRKNVHMFTLTSRGKLTGLSTLRKAKMSMSRA